MDRPHLSVIVASTRSGRQGLPVADWFYRHAVGHAKFASELVDLQEVNLPLFDEPRNPRLRQYEHAHTKAWSARVEKADAFAIVTPEYNLGPPPSLLNAFDFLYSEWGYKPAGFVSYGGPSGGVRSVQASRLTVAALRMMPIPEAVAIPLFMKQIENGVFTATEMQEKAATAMLDELLRWSLALKPLRTS
jgi:NAD(P)H-dependent FMN reductase